MLKENIDCKLEKPVQRSGKKNQRVIKILGENIRDKPTGLGTSKKKVLGKKTYTFRCKMKSVIQRDASEPLTNNEMTKDTDMASLGIFVNAHKDQLNRH